MLIQLNGYLFVSLIILNVYPRYLYLCTELIATLLMSFDFLAPKTFNLFGFQIFWL